jgi:hypothetical protein
VAEWVAEVLFTDTETVHEHRRLYQASCVTGIERMNDEGGGPALNAKQLAALAAKLDARLSMTAKAVCGFVQRSFELVNSSTRWPGC